MKLYRSGIPLLTLQAKSTPFLTFTMVAKLRPIIQQPPTDLARCTGLGAVADADLILPCMQRGVIVACFAGAVLRATLVASSRNRHFAVLA